MTQHDDNLQDREYPDESDMDDSDEPAMLECPNCRKMISEDTEWCHYCGWYLDREPVNPRIWYWVVAALLALGVVVVFVRLR